jgi:hypothetical protein
MQGVKVYGMRLVEGEPALLATSMVNVHICTGLASLAYVVCTLCGDITLLTAGRRWFDGVGTPTRAWEVSRLATLLHVIFACIIGTLGPLIMVWYTTRAISWNDMRHLRIHHNIDRLGVAFATLSLICVLWDICSASILLGWREAAQCMDDGRRDIGGHMRTPTGYSKESCESEKAWLPEAMQAANVALICGAVVCVLNIGLWSFAMKLSRRALRLRREGVLFSVAPAPAPSTLSAGTQASAAPALPALLSPAQHVPAPARKQQPPGLPLPPRTYGRSSASLVEASPAGSKGKKSSPRKMAQEDYMV